MIEPQTYEAPKSLDFYDDSVRRINKKKGEPVLFEGRIVGTLTDVKAWDGDRAICTDAAYTIFDEEALNLLQNHKAYIDLSELGVIKLMRIPGRVKAKIGEKVVDYRDIRGGIASISEQGDFVLTLPGGEMFRLTADTVPHVEGKKAGMLSTVVAQRIH